MDWLIIKDHNKLAFKSVNRSKTENKSNIKRLPTVLLVMLLTFFSLPVLALQLGELQLYSGVNEPLHAEVLVTGVTNAEDLENLSVDLANRQAFSQAGVDRSFFLTNLSFDIEKKTNGALVKIKTTQPVKESYLAFLIEAKTPSKRDIREYTALFDLDAAKRAYNPNTNPEVFSINADVAQKPTANSTASNAGNKAARQQSQPMTITPAVETRSQPANEQASTDVVGSDIVYLPKTRTVKENESIWSIARSLRPSKDITFAQIALALRANNPDAFTDTPVWSTPKPGSVLRVPSKATMAYMSPLEAKAEVKRLAGEQVNFLPEGEIALRDANVLLNANAQNTQTDIEPAEEFTEVEESAASLSPLANLPWWVWLILPLLLLGLILFMLRNVLGALLNKVLGMEKPEEPLDEQFTMKDSFKGRTEEGRTVTSELYSGKSPENMDEKVSSIKDELLTESAALVDSDIQLNEATSIEIEGVDVSDETAAETTVIDDLHPSLLEGAQSLTLDEVPSNETDISHETLSSDTAADLSVELDEDSFLGNSIDLELDEASLNLDAVGVSLDESTIDNALSLDDSSQSSLQNDLDAAFVNNETLEPSLEMSLAEDAADLAEGFDSAQGSDENIELQIVEELTEAESEDAFVQIADSLNEPEELAADVSTSIDSKDKPLDIPPRLDEGLELTQEDTLDVNAEHSFELESAAVTETSEAEIQDVVDLQLDDAGLDEALTDVSVGGDLQLENPVQDNVVELNLDSDSQVELDSASISDEVALVDNSGEAEDLQIESQDISPDLQVDTATFTDALDDALVSLDEEVEDPSAQVDSELTYEQDVDAQEEVQIEIADDALEVEQASEAVIEEDNVEPAEESVEALSNVTSIAPRIETKDKQTDQEQTDEQAAVAAKAAFTNTDELFSQRKDKHALTNLVPEEKFANVSAYRQENTTQVVKKEMTAVEQKLSPEQEARQRAARSRLMSMDFDGFQLDEVVQNHRVSERAKEFEHFAAMPVSKVSNLDFDLSVDMQDFPKLEKKARSKDTAKETIQKQWQVEEALKIDAQDAVQEEKGAFSPSHEDDVTRQKHVQQDTPQLSSQVNMSDTHVSVTDELSAVVDAQRADDQAELEPIVTETAPSVSLVSHDVEEPKVKTGSVFAELEVSEKLTQRNDNAVEAAATPEELSAEVKTAQVVSETQLVEKNDVDANKPAVMSLDDDGFDADLDALSMIDSELDQNLGAQDEVQSPLSLEIDLDDEPSHADNSGINIELQGESESSVSQHSVTEVTELDVTPKQQMESVEAAHAAQNTTTSEARSTSVNTQANVDSSAESSIDESEQVSLKIDLARMYINLGDVESAKEILTELVNDDGLPEYQNIAKKLLLQLSD